MFDSPLGVFGNCDVVDIGRSFPKFEQSVIKYDAKKTVLDTDVILDTERLNESSVMGV